MQQFHYGLVSVSDGKCRPQPARLKVCPDLLVLQREEFLFPDEGDPEGIDNKVSEMVWCPLVRMVSEIYKAFVDD